MLICLNSNDDCSGVLLDDVDAMVKIFNNANVSDIDPAPMLRLVNYQKRRADFAETVLKVFFNSHTDRNVSAITYTSVALRCLG